MIGSYSQHKKDIKAKRAERADRMTALEASGYGEPLNAIEKDAHSLFVEDAVEKVHAGTLNASTLLKAYGKAALASQKEINAVTEFMITAAEKQIEDAASSISVLGGAPTGAPSTSTFQDPKKPLAGFPVSLKDTHNVMGYDSTIGYTANAFHPAQKDSVIVRILKDAGAIPFVKTNVPYTMLSFDCYNDLWGYTENPHLKGYAPGGSTGGESSLLAYGGSRIGVGTDVAGSVRLPAHFSGCYSLKCSVGRFPKTGNTTSMAGQEGIPAVYSPMARTLPDLGYFLKAVIQMKPWTYDYSCVPMPWNNELSLPKKCKVGVIYDDGVVTPSPACRRALDMAIGSLEAQGHEIVKFDAPDPLRALRIASQLLVSDSAKVALRKQRPGEHNDVGVEIFAKSARLPRFFKRIWAWLLENVWGDKVWATLVRDWNTKTITERWDLVAEREGYKAEFFEAWKESGIDFLLTVPNATPAFPHKGLREAYAACGYTFMFNLLDYPAGVLPVTHVDEEKDAMPAGFHKSKEFKKMNRVARGAYIHYDAAKMHGLPVGVQVVAPRLYEETCLQAMELVYDALKKNGYEYELLNA